jgi:hypothetical protein
MILDNQMKKIMAAFLILAISGCASDYNYPTPVNQDLCLSQDLEIYPKYVMKAGRHKLEKSSHKKNNYGTDNRTGTVSSVMYVSVVRYSDSVSHVCMVEFTHELCADIKGLNYCG